MWADALSVYRLQAAADGAWMRLLRPDALTVVSGEIPPEALEALGSWSSVQPRRSTGGCGATMVSGGSFVLLCLPLRDIRGDAVGHLALVYNSEAGLRDDACEQLESSAQALAGVVLQSVALEETQRRLSRVQLLYQVGQAITSTLDLDQVLEEATQRVTEVLSAEGCSLMLADHSTGELVFKIPAGPAERFLREQRMPLAQGIAGWVATHGEPLRIADVKDDERFYVGMDALSGFRTDSILAVPLQVKGRTTGVIEVINKRGGGGFEADDEQWLSILSPMIATAIENARLYGELREEHDRIIAGDDKIRHELARDLHDGPAQILSALILTVDMARRFIVGQPEKMAAELSYMESLAQEANHEIRDLLFSLRPLSLENHGLLRALEQLVERTRSRSPYEVRLELGRTDELDIESSVASTLFVIAQEALNNIQKHANATEVVLRLGVSATQLWIDIIDDGCGFDVRHVDAQYGQRNSFGILNMRERARLVDGVTEILSPAPGRDRGTLVRVGVPLSRACGSPPRQR
jgi:signal transduction histidine kinase